MAFKKKKETVNDLAGLAFVGFLFLGMAIGALYSRWDVGPFLGLAMGFIAMAAIKLKYRK
jgi:hypothetical protein